MFRTFACAVLICLLAGPAPAQQMVWTIDPGHSAAQFSVRHMVVSNVKGQFDGPTGTVAYDPKNPASIRIDATIDARTINTRNPDRDKDLRGDLFFDVAKYPKITFKSTSVQAFGDGKMKVTGADDARRPKPVMLRHRRPDAGIKDIWGSVRRCGRRDDDGRSREFGLVYNRMLEGGGAVVGDRVTISPRHPN